MPDISLTPDEQARMQMGPLVNGRVNHQVTVYCHDEQQMSVDSRPGPGQTDDGLGEYALLVFFAIRMVVNFGQHSEVATRTLAQLGAFNDEAGEIYTAATARTGGIQLVEFGGSKTKKYIEVGLTCANLDVRMGGFRFKPHGCGFFGGGLVTHGPNAVFAAFRSFLERYSSDEVLCNILGGAWLNIQEHRQEISPLSWPRLWFNNVLMGGAIVHQARLAALAEIGSPNGGSPER